MATPSSLKVALKAAKPVVQQYVVSLESQNAKLQKEIGKLEAQNIGYKHEIVALKKELQKLQSKHKPSVDVSAELLARVAALLPKKT